mgnify:CR=1 FL=1
MLPTIIVNIPFIIFVALRCLNIIKVKASTFVLALLIMTPILASINLWVIPAFTTPLTLAQYRAIQAQRVRFWTRWFEDRTLSRISEKPSWRDECSVFIHTKAFDIVKVRDFSQIRGFTKNLCIFKDAEKAAVEFMVQNTNHEDVFLLGHGVLDQGGNEVFAGNLRYSSIGKIASKTGKRITILSCRGYSKDSRKAFKLRWEERDEKALHEHRKKTMKKSLFPHKEGNLYLYGERGFSVEADLRRQLEGWREVMKNN